MCKYSLWNTLDTYSNVMYTIFKQENSMFSVQLYMSLFCAYLFLIIVVSDKTEHGLILNVHLITQIIW